MAFIYNLTDNWNDATATWNGIKLAVTNSGSSASSNLLNLTVTGATTASFVVDKSGNLALNGTVNKITMTAPATGATLTLADGSSFITSGAYSSTFTFTGTTTLTFPTSGTVTALGNTTTGSGSIVLATSPTLVTPALGTPSSVTLTNATGLPLTTGVTGTLAIANGGTGQTTANAAFNALAPSQGGNSGKYLTTDGSNTSWVTNPLGTVTSVDVSGGSTGLSFSGGPITTSGTITMSGTLAVANGGTGLTALGTGVTTALGINVGSAGAFVVNGGVLGTPLSGTLTNATGLPISTGVSGLGTGVATFLATPSSANLASAVTDETGSGPLVFATSPTFTSQVTLGTASSTRGTLVLANTTANTVTLQSSNTTAANYTLTFPAAAPVNGYYLQTDTNGVLSWAAGGGGGGGSPGGSNTQVQFNNAGAFGGDAAFTFVNGTGTATMSLGVASTTSAALKLYNSASANSVSIASGNNSSAWTLTLPTSAGTNGYGLVTDGSGNTSWSAIPSGTINTGTVGQITYYSGTNALSGTTTGTGVLTAIGNNTNSASGLAVLNGSGALAVANGGTGTSTAFTAGSVVFAGASGAYSQDNANFFWDDSNNRLGIGTASPGLPLTVTGIISSTAWQGYSNISAPSADCAIYRAADNTLAFSTLSTERMRLDASGNLGLGAAPNANWSLTSTPILQIGSYGSLYSSTSPTTSLGTNFTVNGSTFSYIASNFASQYFQNSGTHVWRTAASGTAGASFTFTTAMTLDASGDLGLGVTPSAWSGAIALQLAGSGFIASNNQYLEITTNTYYNAGYKYIGTGLAADYNQQAGKHVWSNAVSGTAGGTITFIERASISATAATLSIGTSAATNPGTLQLFASTSGSVSINSPAAPTSWTLTLPSAVPGTAGSVLTSTTGGVSSWTAQVPVANGGTGLASGTSGGVLYYSASGTLASSAALTANALVIGGGAGAAPATTTTGTGVLTALGINVGSAGAVLTTNTSNTITIGYAVTPYSIGTVSSGTTTPAPANGNYQYLTNGGAFTLAAPASDCAIDILVINGGSSGAITFSGFKTPGTGVGGGTYATTNSTWWVISIRRTNGISTYNISGPWT